jgi:hypothetical protein
MACLLGFLPPALAGLDRGRHIPDLGVGAPQSTLLCGREALEKAMIAGLRVDDGGFGG